MSKLELKHIVPYLPYGLEAVEIHNGKVISDEFTIDVVNWDGSCVGGSDASLDSYEFKAYEYLFRNHFDVSGLINKGLAIDKNTLE